MTDFKSMNVPANIVQALERMQITTPTPIQAKSIPLGLAGHDILASAQTGTGKTFSYLIPLLAKLAETPTSTALILTPTRELAAQVRDSITQLLGRRNEFGLALIIGGEAISKQFTQLRSRPRLVIGTPGRVIDHLHRRTLNLTNTAFLVLDETDRMLDMGFHEQLKELAQFLPDERQTFMFSATMPDNITKLAQQYLNDPQRITIGSTTQPIEKIKQDILHTTNSEKFSLLLKELDSREGSIIVFVKTKRGADELVLKLQHKNHSAEAIHGDLKQHKRDRVIREFRNKKNRIMVATDIAARGLDVPHIEHVVNYDLPQCPEDYIHRIGRTGRAGAVGSAITLIAPQDGRLWKMIHNLIHPGIPCNQPSGYNIPAPARGGRRGSSAGGRPGGNSKPFGRSSSSSRDRDDRPREGGFAERRGRDDRPREGGFAERRGREDRPREGGFAERRSREDRPREGGFAGSRGRDDRPREGGFAERRGREDRPREGSFAERRGREDRPREGGFAGSRGREDRPREGGFAERRGRDDRPRASGAPERNYGPREGGFNSRGPSSRDREDRPREGGFASRDRDDRPRVGGFAARGPASKDRSDRPREDNFLSRGQSSRPSFKDSRGSAPRGESASRSRGGNAPAFSRSTKRPASKRV